MLVRFNMNDFIRVKLLEAGFKRWLNYEKTNNAQITMDQIKNRVTPEGLVVIPMSEFMVIFGGNLAEHTQFCDKNILIRCAV